MLSAIEILIARTKTHPEEFSDGQLNKLSKWGDLINNFSTCMTKEEREALAAAMTEAKRTLFNEAVMKRLVGTDELEQFADSSAKMAQRPSKILTTAQITKDAMKILEDEYDKHVKIATKSYSKKYDINTDSYTLTEVNK